MSELEDLFAWQIAAAGVPPPVRKNRFVRDIVGDGPGIRARIRQAGLQDWESDFAWPELLLAVEIDGGTWSGGRHVRGAGFESDCRKCNTLVLHGWRVLRYTRALVESGEALAGVMAIMEQG